MPIPSGYTSGQVVQAVPTGINSALVLIKSQVIGTTVSSVEVTGAFSADYDNYLITINNGATSTGTNLNMKLGTTATGYYYRGIYGTFASTTNTGDREENVAVWGSVGQGSANGLDAYIRLHSPFLAKNATYYADMVRADTGSSGFVNQYGGYLANTTSYTAFTIGLSTGTMTGGTIRVYGYANS
jgi:hypothetical protein